MAEYVGLQSKSPDVFGTISQLLGIRGQMAQVQQEQQTAAQRKGIAEYFANRDPMELYGEDGTVDPVRLLNPEFLSVAGDQAPQVLSSIATLRQQQLESKGTLLGLNTNTLNAYRGFVGGLQQDPDVVQDNEKGRQKVNDALMQFGDAYGKSVLPVVSAYAKQFETVPKGKLSQALQIVQMQANDAGKQLEAQRPTLTNLGDRLWNSNPYSPSGGMSIGLNLSPTEKIPYLTDTENNKRFSEEVNNVRVAADKAPIQTNIFRNILRLSGETSTGPLIKFLQETKIGGQAFGDNYQELAKYLERNAIESMAAMGGSPSDSRLSAAVAANGSTGFNPQALRAVTQFNYAANTGLEMYRKGIDKAVGTTNPDYLKLPEFKSQWAANFDIDALRLENAVRDGDKAEQAAILKGLSPAQAAALADKLDNLHSLSKTGKLP